MRYVVREYIERSVRATAPKSPARTPNTNLPDDPGIIPSSTHPHTGPGHALQWPQPLVSVGLVRRLPQPKCGHNNTTITERGQVACNPRSQMCTCRIYIAAVPAST